MLTDPKFQYDLQMLGIFSLIGQGGEPEKVEDGIFISPSFSFDTYITKNVDSYYDFGELESYGVCDSTDQVKEKYAHWLNDPKLKFCVAFTKIVKSEQSSWGGWRWHKWGEYIGDKNPQYEYIHDEGDEIQEVYVYHIYKLN